MNQDGEGQAGTRGTGQVSAFACGLLCGAALGAVVALLYAPKPGAEVRRQMTDSAERLKRRATGAYDDASHAVSDVMARGRRAIEVGREAFQSARPAHTPTTSSGAAPLS